ncbi:MAG: ABC transporter ATP-binding protein [Bacilli bacterium]|nr:ABC transporter ATP-binding protein [Bacilli bacterium]
MYGEQKAVDQLTLTIEKGEVFGLLGPNGAGKSTTILMLLGLIEPTSGTIRVNGIDPVRNPLEVKRQVGYLPDNLGFYPQMTGLDNLLYIGSLNGLSQTKAKKLAYELLEQVGLSEAAHKKTGTYSRGMKQRLGIAEVLMKEPEIIILDEPTLGLDPEGVRDLLKLIRRLNEERKMTILLSSHQLHQVQQICDRVGIFVKGRLIAKGNLSELVRQLFANEPHIVEAKTSPLDDALLKEIETIKGVVHIEKVSTESFICYCEIDLSAEIAEKIVSSGAKLYMLNRKDFGLDEIYHRYFEGRETDETTTVR